VRLQLLPEGRPAPRAAPESRAGLADAYDSTVAIAAEALIVAGSEAIGFARTSVFHDLGLFTLPAVFRI
jgi:hypothetical protein